MTRPLALALALCACGPEIIQVQLPVGDAASMALAVEYDDLLEILAQDLPSDAPLPTFERFSGDARATLLLFDAPLDALSLPSGKVTPASERRFEQPLPEPDAILRLEVDEDPSAWERIDEMPAELTRFRAAGPDRCSQWEVEPLELDEESQAAVREPDGSVLVISHFGSFYRVTSNGLTRIPDTLPALTATVAAVHRDPVTEQLYVVGHAELWIGTLADGFELGAPPPRGKVIDAAGGVSIRGGVELYVLYRDGRFARYESGNWTLLRDPVSDGHSGDGGVEWIAPGRVFAASQTRRVVLEYDQSRREDVAIDLALPPNVVGDLEGIVNVPSVGPLLLTPLGVYRVRDGFPSYAAAAAVTDAVRDALPHRSGFVSITQDAVLVHFVPGLEYCDRSRPISHPLRVRRGTWFGEDDIVVTGTVWQDGTPQLLIARRL